MIKNLTQTCWACPSQWHAQTDCGRNIYVRYRWGTLSVYLSDYQNQRALDCECIFSKDLGDCFDGVIAWDSISALVENAIMKKIMAEKT